MSLCGIRLSWRISGSGMLETPGGCRPRAAMPCSCVVTVFYMSYVPMLQSCMLCSDSYLLARCIAW